MFSDGCFLLHSRCLGSWFVLNNWFMMNSGLRLFLSFLVSGNFFNNFLNWLWLAWCWFRFWNLDNWFFFFHRYLNWDWLDFRLFNLFYDLRLRLFYSFNFR